MDRETETKSRDSITDDYSYMQFGFTAIIPCIQLLSDEKQEKISHWSSWKLNYIDIWNFFITSVFQCVLIVLLFHFYLSVMKLTVALSIGLLYH